MRNTCPNYLKRDETIKQLESRIKTLELQLGIADADHSNSKSGFSQVHLLEKCCQQLQKQVLEMEEFLHDYGLVWVGTQTTSQSGTVLDRDYTNQKAKILDRIIWNIESLNQWIGAGEARITRDPSDPKKAYLKEQEPIPLTLYADGISLHEGPFRPFTQHETMQFVQDILDGFFPSELEIIYPEGVPFRLIDKRQVEFLKTFSETQNAHMLGGNGKKSCLVEKMKLEDTTQSDQSKKQSCDGIDYPTVKLHKLSSKATDQREQNLLDQLELYPCPRRDPLTFSDLLERLPESKIGKSGQIISIREDLRQTIASAVQSVPVKQVDISDSANNQSSEGNSDQSEFIALRIRSENGSYVYNIRMAKSDTVGQLYSCINAVRDSIIPYRLITLGPAQQEDRGENSLSDFPNPCYRHALTEMDQTLESAGLKTRTVLRMEFNRDAKFSLCPTSAMKKSMWNPLQSVATEKTDSFTQ
ncbi:hypothetical protein FGIG_11968 [Fasciola gigantica]|uniref:UBX domain-containing protein 11 n=1 Tax=Fasciola gigantica TaxID=46835 RepID=A0A504Z5G1_FASGI|nr:hypothetical protein FGIG_11968 [Fasciola gigantica]